MNTDEVVEGHTDLETTEELPSTGCSRFIRFQLELGSSPIRRLFGGCVEVGRFIECAVVVIAHQRPITVLRDEIDAGHGIRAIAQNVAKTDDPIGVSGRNIVEYHPEGFEIAMDVTDDCGSHVVLLPAGKRGCYVLGCRTVNATGSPD